MLTRKTRHTSIFATLFAILLTCVTSAFADDDGPTGQDIQPPISVASPPFILGLEGGYANTHWNNIAIRGISVSSSGFAARGFLGYAFNQYFGLESGYTYLPNAEVRGRGFNEDIRNYAVDVLGKVSIPVTSGLNVFAKAGLGYLNSSAPHVIGQASTSHFGPAFGVGAGYEVVPNLALNLSWIRYIGNGDISDRNYQPNPDAILFGMSYKFPMSSS